VASKTQTWATWSGSTWEVLADAGNTANITYAKDATDTSAKFTCVSKSMAATTEYARKSGAGDSWATIFAVPANAVVKKVQVTAWKKKTVANTKLSALTFKIRLINDAGTAAVDADLISANLGTSTDGSYGAQSAGSEVNVVAGSQAASSAVRLSLEITITTGGTSSAASVDVRFDDVVLSVTYEELKTVDGLAKASIKTVDGLLIASVKTVSGLQ
jgi:hypothetical protein